MSVRIHEIAKAIGRENKEVLDILRERGFEVKTVSSSIDNISAEAFIEEFKKDDVGETNEVISVDVAKVADVAVPVVEEKPVAAPKPSTRPKFPAGAFVRSSEDVERERQEKIAQEHKRRENEIAKRRGVIGAAPKMMPVKAMERSSKAPPMPPRLGSKVPPAPNLKMPPPLGIQAPSMPSSKTQGAAISAPKVSRPIPPRPSVQAREKGESPAIEKTEVSADHKSSESGELKLLQIKPPIAVREFAGMIEVKPFKLISELMDMGIFAGMNQTLDEDVAIKIAKRHGYELEVKYRVQQTVEPQKPKEKEIEEDDPSLLEPRPPVVCVLGHVDHGKTTLVDRLRHANVVAGEAGGITQHIGAYQVEQNGHKITFIDTPGHAAFSKMRERGASVTDIAILIVAADDGFMPQTDEALKFAQKANVPVVVAINKIDAKGADLDKVQQQMQQRNIASEDWGGETLCSSISALKGDNIENLLDQIVLQAEILELKANPKAQPRGVVVESQVEPGRGCTATVIMQKGTLKVGEALVCGTHYCKVRAMVNEHGKTVKQAGPACPVRLLGWSGAPAAGSVFHAVKNEKTAKREVEENLIEQKRETEKSKTRASDTPMDLDSLMAAIVSKQQKCLRLVVKADVAGSTEALLNCLGEIKTDKVKLQIIDSGVGQITKSDIDLANSSDAAVIGFNVRLDNGVLALAKHSDVQLIQHNIIYELITQTKEAMADLLDSEYRESKLGAAEVRQIFPIAKGQVAGCMITEGLIKRDMHARVIRKEKVLHEGRISTLKRFKDDAAEVRSGYECGVQVSGFNSYEEKDVIECYEMQEFRPKL